MADQQSKKAGFYLLFLSLALTTISGLFAVQAHFDYLRHSQSFLDLHEQANARQTQAQFHRARGGVSSMAMIEEAAREAPPKDLGGKRLALSIALTQNSTGFEDNFIDKAQKNASDDELNRFRNTFLTQLFEAAPSSLRRQEVIQMHMDVLLNELRHAARLLSEAQSLNEQAAHERVLADKASLQSQLCWKALILLLLSSVLSLALIHYRKPWLVFISGALVLYGAVLMVRALLL